MTDWNAHRASDSVDMLTRGVPHLKLQGAFFGRAGRREHLLTAGNPYTINFMRSHRSELPHRPMCTGDRVEVLLHAYLLERIDVDELVARILNGGPG